MSVTAFQFRDHNPCAEILNAVSHINHSILSIIVNSEKFALYNDRLNIYVFRPWAARRVLMEADTVACRRRGSRQMGDYGIQFCHVHRPRAKHYHDYPVGKSLTKFY